jgi:hypothetical protein
MSGRARMQEEAVASGRRARCAGLTSVTRSPN